MIPIKTLSWPLMSAMFMVGAGTLHADLAFSISTSKTFRQNKSGNMNFTGGSYNVFFRDGAVTFVGGCDAPYYYPPDPKRVCSGGSTAYVTFGNLIPGTYNSGPYYWVTSVVPGLIVAPRRADLCQLYAAPASKLVRPSTGFTDDSYGVYYNLHDKNSVVESIITRYYLDRTYSGKQAEKFSSEIVPGVYHYTFPRLNYEILKVPVNATVYPISEGRTVINQQAVGVQFKENARWTKSGFMELSYLKPNKIEWQGFSPSNVFPSVDVLHFALRYIKNSKDPLSPVVTVDPVTGDSPSSLFPGFVNNGGDPRVALVNPYQTSFTVPSILKSGSTAVAELSLDRNFQTGGITYDFSDRKFQIPVMVVNRFTDYQDLRFKDSTKNTGILDDFDGDGFNNMTEWILSSRAEDKFSVPINPVPVNHADNYYYYWFYYYNYYKPQWFGFIFDKVRKNVPAIRYTLQRSFDGGKTWSTFRSDGNWFVDNTPEGYYVSSLVTSNGVFVQPPGTEGDIYRVKITLRKKKK